MALFFYDYDCGELMLNEDEELDEKTIRTLQIIEAIFLGVFSTIPTSMLLVGLFGFHLWQFPVTALVGFAVIVFVGYKSEEKNARD